MPVFLMPCLATPFSATKTIATLPAKSFLRVRPMPGIPVNEMGNRTGLAHSLCSFVNSEPHHAVILLASKVGVTGKADVRPLIVEVRGFCPFWVWPIMKH